MKRSEECQRWEVNRRELWRQVERLVVQLLPVQTVPSTLGRVRGREGGIRQMLRARD